MDKAIQESPYQIFIIPIIRKNLHCYYFRDKNKYFKKKIIM